MPLVTSLALALSLSQTAPVSPLEVRLRAHVRFLASDKLEGRDSPSLGLDIAADYIAGEFEKSGIAPGVKDSYLQMFDHTRRRGNISGKVANVIGIIPGTDAKLKDEYIFVTAHYDHLGKREGEGDQIFNGANDNASGTAGVIEIGRLIAMKPTKRSVVLMTFWGEEQGLQGARAYIGAPVFPLAKTIAMVNLEQIGRTDDSEGPRVSEFNFTGFDYSDLPERFKKVIEPSGVKVTKHPRLSDPYFNASDNAAFAGAGIPAHTISVAYSFPDYHKVGDHWDKLDYANMAKLVDAMAKGVRAIADDAKPVKWNETDRTKRYVDAWKKLTGGG